MTEHTDKMQTPPTTLDTLRIEIDLENIYNDEEAMFAVLGGFLHSLGQMMIGAAATKFTAAMTDQLVEKENVSTDGESTIKFKVYRRTKARAISE